MSLYLISKGQKYTNITVLCYKSRRESAQYEATPTITRENTISSLSDAEEFITKIEEILQ